MSSCGRWAYYHIPSKSLIRWFCGSANCHRDKCRNLFFSARVRLISALIDEFELYRFFTLTLNRDIIPSGDDPWDYIHKPWSKFRKRMNRRFDNFKFVSILESHKNEKFPHIHGFTNVWMAQKDWSQIWNACGGGEIVWINRVDDKEISNYVSKELQVAKYVGKENLIDGYKQRKNHRTLWRSKNTKAKFELTQSKDWDIIKQEVYNEDGQMTDYYAQKGVWAYGKDQQQRKNLEATRSSLP